MNLVIATKTHLILFVHMFCLTYFKNKVYKFNYVTCFAMVFLQLSMRFCTLYFSSVYDCTHNAFSQIRCSLPVVLLETIAVLANFN